MSTHKVYENGKLLYRQNRGYEFIKPEEKTAIKNFEDILIEERQAAASMVKLADKQINALQQRINFWYQIKQENKKIAIGQDS